MNLRKTRFSSGQKRNSSCKDIHSPVKKRKCLRLSENSKISTGDLSKSPVKRQKSSMNLVTSTPIPHKISKTISRTPNRRNSNEIAMLDSSKRASCFITSSPILKTSCTTKSCEVRLTDVRSGRKRCPAERKSNCIFGSSKISPKNQSHFSLNSSVEASGRNVRSTRKSTTSQNAFKELPDNLRSSRRSSPIMPQTALRLIEENLKKISVYQNEVRLHNKKSVGKSKDVRSVSAKSKKSIVEKPFDAEVSQKSTDNLKGSRYNSRKPLSTVTENKPEKQVSHFPSTPKNNGSVFKISKEVLKRQKKDINVEVPQCSKASLIKTSNETKSSKSSRHSLRLLNKQSSNATSSNGLNSKSDRINRVMAKIEKRELKARKDNAEISGRKLRSSEGGTSKKTTKTDLSLKRSSKRSLPAKKQNVTKNLRKEPSKRQKKPTLKRQRRCLSYTEDIPLDDLSLAVNCHRRKVKSDGYKRQSSKLIFKRKLSAIEALKKADEDYEDDIFEGQEEKFEIFKDLLMDTSDSEKSFSVSSVQTPKFPITPHLRQKTPKCRFPSVLFSPTQFAASRKAALEYMYIRQKRREAYQKVSSESPVMAETNRPGYSQALEEAQKVEENLQSLAAEDSDNDSYFSFA